MKLLSRTRAAFTLAEVMVALTMFSLTAAAASAALLRMNNNASLSRLQTGASTVAQNQVDRLLLLSPFNPRDSKVPDDLTVGTHTEGTEAAPTVPVYTDPKTGGMQILGWTTTVVEDMHTMVGSTDLHLYRIQVTVQYKFRGRTYAVQTGTVRASDS